MILTIVSTETYDKFLNKVLSSSSIVIKDLTDFEESENYVFDELNQDLCALFVDEGFLRIQPIQRSHECGIYDNKDFLEKCKKLYPKKVKVTRESLASRIQKWHKNPDEHLYKNAYELLDEFDWN